MLKKPAPTSRRAAREVALRVLYSVEVGQTPLYEALEETIAVNGLEPDMAVFAEALVRGVEKNLPALNDAITTHAEGYSLERQTAVDRCLLRLAAAEALYHLSDAPVAVIVNEAVEIAKKYSTDDSSRFVHGVLGGILQTEKMKPPQKNEP
jgi:N utilization substance protein B